MIHPSGVIIVRLLGSITRQGRVIPAVKRSRLSKKTVRFDSGLYITSCGVRGSIEDLNKTDPRYHLCTTIVNQKKKAGYPNICTQKPKTELSEAIMRTGIKYQGREKNGGEPAEAQVSEPKTF